MISNDLPIDDIRRCSQDAAFLQAVKAVFDSVDTQVGATAPVCINRGACCRFESYGHDLFVTSVELAYFVGCSDEELLAPPDRSFCPYQQGGKCVARVQRPLGCRVYFCEDRSQHWQSDLTEATLRKLAEIGEQFQLEYAYLEWTTGLRKLADRVVEQSAEAPVSLSIDSLSKRS